MIKPSTYVGPDGIPNVLLKNCATALSLPLSHIYDTSFKDSILPCCWKTANVLPIFKKGCTKNPTNYRPISLTTTCCRAMERIINNDILNFLLVNYLITRHQHGFVRKRSTCTNLWSVYMTGLSLYSHAGKPMLFILTLKRRLILFAMQNC